MTACAAPGAPRRLGCLCNSARTWAATRSRHARISAWFSAADMNSLSKVELPGGPSAPLSVGFDHQEKLTTALRMLIAPLQVTAQVERIWLQSWPSNRHAFKQGPCI